jgi:hypothetical protein
MSVWIISQVFYCTKVDKMLRDILAAQQLYNNANVLTIFIFFIFKKC